jgi:hypothetical protein
MFKGMKWAEWSLFDDQKGEKGCDRMTDAIFPLVGPS